MADAVVPLMSTMSHLPVVAAVHRVILREFVEVVH
jgi:hypothetical protein